MTPMTPGIEKIAVFGSETVSIEVSAPDRMAFVGTIAVRDPTGLLQAHLRRIHEVALSRKLTRLTVDMRKLTFVNSSALRLFIDWVGWLKRETDKRYRLIFVIDPTVTWQKTSFGALRSIAGDIIDVRTEP